MKEYHFFASANTVGGFRNHFDSMTMGDFTYVLKGSSGSGKSTLMKSIGKHFEDKGYDVEYFHCSSDKDSLDGVRIVGKSVCIVDGTAPHVMEASLPQVNSRLVNICECISKDIKKHKEVLEKLVKEKAEKFNQMYGYLKSAGSLVEMEKGKSSNRIIEEKYLEIIKKLQIKKSSKHISPRLLYLRCVDKGGLYSLPHHLTTLNVDMQSIMGGTELMNRICKTLDNKNAQYIKIISPLGDDLLDGVAIPSSNLYICNNATDANTFKNNHLITLLLKKAGNTLNEARIIHKKIEKYYVSHMDFDKLNIIKENIIEEIESM